MNEIVNFLRDYWQYISIVLVILFDILILIVKRRPRTIDDFLIALNEGLALVPVLVKQVECVGNGAKKKNDVISAVVQFVACHLGRSLTNKESEIATIYASNQIEAVLAAPQKKEVK